MAQEMASWGYDVYGIDTKRYLEAFTTGTATLSESQVTADMAAIARSVRAGNEKIILTGWSEGAGLCLLGAAGPGSRDVFTGVAAIGLGERTALGWRLADNITWITKRAPDEPTFTSLPYMARLSPLPLAMVHSSGDEYTSVDAAKKLFAGAAEPKRLDVIPARNHRFDGGREPFFKALAAALEWIGGEPQ